MRRQAERWRQSRPNAPRPAPSAAGRETAAAAGSVRGRGQDVEAQRVEFGTRVSVSPAARGAARAVIVVQGNDGRQGPRYRQGPRRRPSTPGCMSALQSPSVPL